MHHSTHVSLATALLDSLEDLDRPRVWAPVLTLLVEFSAAIEQAKALQSEDLDRANARLEVLAFISHLLNRDDWKNQLEAASGLNAEAAAEYLDAVLSSVAEAQTDHARLGA
jgi:hypothetical protein